MRSSYAFALARGGGWAVAGGKPRHTGRERQPRVSGIGPGERTRSRRTAGTSRQSVRAIRGRIRADARRLYAVPIGSIVLDRGGHSEVGRLQNRRVEPRSIVELDDLARKCQRDPEQQPGQEAGQAAGRGGRGGAAWAGPTGRALSVPGLGSGLPWTVRRRPRAHKRIMDRLGELTRRLEAEYAGARERRGE
jgi:hypothetical protein